MARSLNKKYFGNRNIGSTSTTADDGIGGEGVASITLGGTNNSSGYAVDDPLDISAPDLPGGVQATAKVATINGSGKILTVEVTEKGSGYINVPTVTESVGGVQGTLTFTAVLTTDSGAVRSETNQENAIIAYAQTTSGGSRVVGDIIRQVSGRRYKVKTANGTAICKLRTDGLSGVNTMDITAFDSAGGEYWVWKLTGRKAVLVVKGTNGGTQFATGTSVPWTMGSATENYNVTIQNA